MEKFQYNRYFTSVQTEEFLLEMQKKHPDVCKLESLAKTDGGRNIWCVTLAAGDTVGYPPEKRPALYAQGGLHAEEGMGITAALALIHNLLESPDSRKQLEEMTVYVLPCVNPDGDDECMIKGMNIRSKIDRLPGAPLNELVPCDLDGDGRVLSMRWEDPTGEWKEAPGCGSFMVSRLPGDTEGPFYKMCMEGMVENYDGSGQIKPPRRLDMNRQFPHNWGHFHMSDDYPGRAVEVRTIMDFMVSHPNIFTVFDFHCGGRGISIDVPNNPQEANLVRKFMMTAEEISGIKCYPNETYGKGEHTVHVPRYGYFQQYAYRAFGIMACYLELGYGWNSIGEENKDIWDSPDGLYTQDFISRLTELHEKHNSELAAPWVKYQHPQLGEVEIGGRIYGNSGLMLAEDMNEVLPGVVKLVREIMNWHPRLELVNVEKEAMGGDVVRIRADIINTGKMSTSVLSSVLIDDIMLFPVRLYVSGADEILSRTAMPEFKNLNALESHHLEWFVKAKPGAELTVTAVHPRAGIVKSSFIV